MSRLYAPAVGEADCFLLRLDTPAGTKNVLIDGGSRDNQRINLKNWLRAHGVQALDLMILTHLHQDHLGQLPELAERMPVAQAVLPYPPFAIDLAAHGRRVTELAAYDRLCTALTRQGTVWYTAFPRTMPEFVFGAYRLTALSPEAGERSAVYDGLHGLTEAVDARYEDVKGTINRDSAVWLVQRDGNDCALFCGDCESDAVERAMARRELHPRLVKLSHHGRNDKGRTYFTAEMLQKLGPEQVIITWGPEKSPACRADWQALCPTARLALTDDAAELIWEI